MKAKIFTLALLFAITLTALAGNTVYAQEPTCDPATNTNCPPPATCDPTTGANCPPPTDVPSTGGNGSTDTDNDNNSGGGGGGNPNPPTVVTVTPSPVPTATPLSFALPESDYLGSCNSASGSLQDCLDQFTCEDGLLVIKVDIYTGGNGTQYDVYCIPHVDFPKLDLPIVLPPDQGSTDDTNWGGACLPGDYDVDQCVEDFAAMCDSDGGDLSVWYDDDGSAGVYCENSTPADSQPAPTEAPAIAAAPTDDGSEKGDSWDESCTFDGCYGLALWCSLYDGGTGYGMDDGNGGYYYHCDLPDDEEGNIPPGRWALGFLGLALIVFAKPAYAKFRIVFNLP